MFTFLRLLRMISRNFRRKLIFSVVVLILISYYVLFKEVKEVEDPEKEAQKIKPQNEYIKLAVLVPCRDCFDQLEIFVPYLTKYLEERKITNHIFIINQTEKYLFNRGALMNVGFSFAKDTFDYFAIHDVDLIPLNQELPYNLPNDGVMHLSVNSNDEVVVSFIASYFL